MTQVGICLFRADLCASHEKLEIGVGGNIIRFQWSGEAWPACPGLIFIERAEQRLAGDYIYVNASLFVVPILIRVRSFRAFVLRDFVLQGRQSFSKLGV